jgi:hypothetical protein
MGADHPCHRGDAGLIRGVGAGPSGPADFVASSSRHRDNPGVWL